MNFRFRPCFPLLPLIFGLLLAVTSVIAGVSDQAASAHAQLVNGQHAEALSSYRSLLDSPLFSEKASPELWYNRGLAEMKTGDNVAASLSFRRALLLDPTLVPARADLATVTGLLGLPPSSVPNAGPSSLVLPERLILGGSLVGWIGVLTSVFLFFFGRQRRGLIALALTVFVAGHGLAVFGTLIDPRRTARDEAVVVSKTGPTLRATPADNGIPSGKVAPGSLISVLSRNGAWWYVSAGPGQTGWIPSDTVTPLLPSVTPSASAKGS